MAVYYLSLSLSTALSFPLLLVIIIMRPLYKFYYFTIEGYDVFIIIEFISRIDLLIEKEIHWLSKYVLIYLLLALFSITTVEVQIFHSCHVPQSYLITFIYSPKKYQNITHKLFWASMNISLAIGLQIFHISLSKLDHDINHHKSLKNSYLIQFHYHYLAKPKIGRPYNPMHTSHSF